MEELMEELPSIIISVDKSRNTTPREPWYEQEEPKGNNTNPIISDYFFYYFTSPSNQTAREEMNNSNNKKTSAKDINMKNHRNSD